MVQVQLFGTGTRSGLEILHQFDKSVNPKSQKVFGANSNVGRSYKEETGEGGDFLPPYLPHPE